MTVATLATECIRELSYRVEVILQDFEIAMLFLDCEQSLFSSKIHGEEHKTSKHVSVIPHHRSQVTLTVTIALRSSPQFSRKRETARSLCCFKFKRISALS